MYIKDGHLRLAHRTLPLWWWLSFCPHLVAAALTCEYLALEAYCSPRSGTLQASSCLTFVLAFSFYFYSIFKKCFLSGATGLCCCTRASLVAGSCCSWRAAPGAPRRGFSGCGARAPACGSLGLSVRGVRSLPAPGIEPAFPGPGGWTCAHCTTGEVPGIC